MSHVSGQSLGRVALSVLPIESNLMIALGRLSGEVAVPRKVDTAGTFWAGQGLAHYTSARCMPDPSRRLARATVVLAAILTPVMQCSQRRFSATPRQYAAWVVPGRTGALRWSVNSTRPPSRSRQSHSQTVRAETARSSAICRMGPASARRCSIDSRETAIFGESRKSSASLVLRSSTCGSRFRWCRSLHQLLAVIGRYVVIT